MYANLPLSTTSTLVYTIGREYCLALANSPKSIDAWIPHYRYCLFGINFSTLNFLILIKIHGGLLTLERIWKKSIAFAQKNVSCLRTWNGTFRSYYIINLVDWLFCAAFRIEFILSADELLTYANMTYTNDGCFVHLIGLFIQWMIVVHGIVAAVMRCILLNRSRASWCTCTTEKRYSFIAVRLDEQILKWKNIFSIFHVMFLLNTMMLKPSQCENIFRFRYFMNLHHNSLLSGESKLLR